MDPPPPRAGGAGEDTEESLRRAYINKHNLKRKQGRAMAWAASRVYVLADKKVKEFHCVECKSRTPATQPRT